MWRVLSGLAGVRPRDDGVMAVHERVSRFLAIAGKELAQLRRDRLTFGMIVGIPLIQILLFGYAINYDIRHLTAGVADEAQTHLSRRLVAEAEASQVIDVVTRVASGERLEALLRAGEVNVGLFIPADFDRRLQDARPAAQLLVDDSSMAVTATARLLLQLPFEAHAAQSAVATSSLLALRPLYNPENSTAVQVVPALIGVILTMTMVLFTAVAIARERERGNMEMLISTPVTGGELMTGKIAPYIFIGLLQVTIILTVGAWLFDVPVRGSIADLYLASAVFIAASLAVGLLISTVAATQFQAMQLTFFFFLPSILLSGFMFPFEGMPAPVQWFAELLPLTHFVRIVRGIVLRAANLAEVRGELYALGLFFVAVMTFTILRFSKRLG